MVTIAKPMDDKIDRRLQGPSPSENLSDNSMDSSDYESGNYFIRLYHWYIGFIHNTVALEPLLA